MDRVVAVMEGQAALPRKNGELVFEEPWQGRVFGMAVALHERGVYDWEEFRQALIAQIAAAETRRGPFVYYEIWLQTFEALLARKRLVTSAELDETTYQFEFGERDDVFHLGGGLRPPSDGRRAPDGALLPASPRKAGLRGRSPRSKRPPWALSCSWGAEGRIGWGVGGRGPSREPCLLRAAEAKRPISWLV